MKALVTGARGFVGTHLMAHLQDSGDEAVGIDRSIDDLDILDAPALLELFRDGSIAFDQASPLGDLTVRWVAGDREADVSSIDEFEGAPVPVVAGAQEDES